MIYEKETSGADVQQLINEKLLPVLHGQPLEVVSAACLSMLLVQMYDGLTEDQLLDGVKGASGWIVSYLSSIDDANQAAAGVKPALAN